MGKTIVSWSPVHGQGATTSNIAALASMFALTYNAKNLITHTQLTYSSLESLFGKVLEERGFEDMGMAALERLAKSNLLKAEAVMDYTETIYTGRLDILGGTKRLHTSQDLIEILLEYIKDAYDLVWIDAHSGLRNELTVRLLKKADVVLVNLPQNRYILDHFFKGEDFPEFFKEKEVIVLISSYDPDSSFSVKKIERRYKAKVPVLPINYSHHFKDAQNKLILSEFFYRNKDATREHPAYHFIQSLNKVNKLIAKKIGITKVSEGEDEEHV